MSENAGDPANEPRSPWKRILGNSAWSTVERGAAIGPMFVATILAARHLSTAAFGELSLLLALITVALAIVTAGVREMAVVRLAQGEDRNATLLAAARLYGLVAVLLSPAAYALGSTLIETPTAKTALVFACLRILLAPLEVPLIWFQAALQARWLALARVVSGVALTTAVLFADTLADFAFAWLLEGAFWGCGLIALYIARAPTAAQRQGPPVRNLWRESLPIMITTISVVIYMRVDQMMLVGLDSNVAAGLYAAAARVSESFYFVPGVVAVSVLPTFVAHGARTMSSEALHTFRATQLGLATFAYSIIGFFQLTGSGVLGVLFGSEYTAAAPILQIHCVGFLFVCSGMLRGRWLSAAGLAQLETISTIAGACANVGLNLVLIPRYGGIGAAGATVVSQGLATYLSSGVYRPLRPVFREQSLALIAPLVLLYHGIRRLTGRSFKRPEA